MALLTIAGALMTIQLLAALLRHFAFITAPSIEDGANICLAVAQDA